MNILEALEVVAAQVPAIKTVHYADLNEANGTLVDQLTSAEYPALVIIPITPVDNITPSGLIRTTFELQAFLLSKVPNVTTDYKASVVENQVIAPMRELARQYMHKLSRHAIIDPQSGGITQMTYSPEYSAMDAALFGVLITATVPVVENPRVCIS